MVDLEHKGCKWKADFYPRQSFRLSSHTLKYQWIRRGLESVNPFELMPEVGQVPLCIEREEKAWIKP